MNKKRKMNKAYLLLLTATMLLVSFAAKAQVTIGGGSDPVAGAILDLNSTGGHKGGLLLSNVYITDPNKIPTGLVGIAAEQDTNPDLTGMIVYNTNAATGIGIYVWDGDAWVKLSKPLVPDPVCGRINNVFAFAKGAGNIIGTSGDLEFGVLSDGSNLSVVSPTKKTYRWQRTGAGNMIWADQGVTQDYTSDSQTITFPGEGTYHVRVIAGNCFSLTKTSNEIKVEVAANPVNLINGNYGITGANCYDVARTGNMTGRLNAFAGGFIKPYKFVFGAGYTDLQMLVLSDPSGLVSGLSSPSAGQVSGTGSGAVDFNLVFKSTVGDLVGNKGKKTVKIGASYKDNTGADKLAYMDIKVEDADCACKVAYRNSGSGDITGWKKFMCYNLGADSSLSIDRQRAVNNPTPTSNISYANEAAAADYTKVNGSLFQWGRKADGHQQVWSAVTSGKVATANWNNADANFRNVSAAPHDWLDGTNPKPGRWGGDANGENNTGRKGPNDPCPPGWKVPTLGDWQSIMNGSNSGTTTIPYNGVNRWVWVSNANNTTAGYLVYPPKNGVTNPSANNDYETTPSLFLPAAGLRQGVAGGGRIMGAGTGGRYRSTAIGNDTSWNLSFSDTGVKFDQAGMFHVHGNSVRCIAE